MAKLFKHWTSWSYVPYAIVHRSVLQWTRRERVPLLLYERTCVLVHHFHFMTACYDCIPQTPGKSRQFLTFPNNHRRQSKVLYFSIFTTQPSISSLSQCPTGHESRRFPYQGRVKYIYWTQKSYTWIKYKSEKSCTCAVSRHALKRDGTLFWKKK